MNVLFICIEMEVHEATKNRVVVSVDDFHQN